MTNLPEWIGIFTGIITGSSGLVLGILNYLRDNPEVAVSLQWAMQYFGESASDKGKLFGEIRVTNIGRRPIFVSHVTIMIPDTHELFISDSINGEKLSEGDPPKIYPVNQEGLEKYHEVWNYMYVIVRDSAGKKYLSQPAMDKPFGR